MKSKEAQIQSAIIERANLHIHIAPELQWLHAIPNGGHRNVVEAVNLKRQGVKAGVLDLFLPVGRHDYHGFYLEIKYNKGKLTANQEVFLDFVQEQNYLARVYWDVDPAWDDLKWYLGIADH